jgi:hypothetical protein
MNLMRLYALIGIVNGSGRSWYYIHFQFGRFKYGPASRSGSPVLPFLTRTIAARVQIFDLAPIPAMSGLVTALPVLPTNSLQGKPARMD